MIGLDSFRKKSDFDSPITQLTERGLLRQTPVPKSTPSS